MATIIDGSLAPRGKKISFPNGMKWEQSNVTSGIDFLYIYYADGIWVASSIGKGSTKSESENSAGAGLYYSLNGKSWAQSNITTGKFYGLYKANGIWVACSYNYNGLYYSVDGKMWTQSNITSGTFYSVYNANGLWVAGSKSGKGLYYSTNGKSWTQSNTTSYDFPFVTNANGIWVACSNRAGQGLYYSLDGKSWNLCNLSGGNFLQAHYFQGVWVATSNGSQGIYYSTDGKTWSQSNIGAGHSSYPICDADGICVVGSYSNEGLWYSKDGKNWQATNITSGYFCSIYYAQGIWLAGEYPINTSINGNLYYSLDGKTWAKVEGIDSYHFWGFYNANGIWVLGKGNGLYYSPTWEVSTPPHPVSEEWVLKSSVTVSPLTVSGGDVLATKPLNADFSSGLTDYDQFVLAQDGSIVYSLGDYFTI